MSTVGGALCISSAHLQEFVTLSRYRDCMTQQPTTPSPLTAKLYQLDYPRSLGTYSTYEEVQAVVDTLADEDFPVQRTMIVGTDLKLIERVTGRRSWGRALASGIGSGIWMGVFIGLLFMLFSKSPWTMLMTSIVMGVVFFTVWSLIGYGLSQGKRDFTSMTATIPMQYELMVEHSDAAEARRILQASGAMAPEPAPAPASTSERPVSSRRPSYGQPAPSAPSEAPSSFAPAAPPAADAPGAPDEQRGTTPPPNYPPQA